MQGNNSTGKNISTQSVVFFFLNGSLSWLCILPLTWVSFFNLNFRYHFLWTSSSSSSHLHYQHSSLLQHSYPFNTWKKITCHFISSSDVTKTDMEFRDSETLSNPNCCSAPSSSAVRKVSQSIVSRQSWLTKQITFLLKRPMQRKWTIQLTGYVFEGEQMWS